MITLLKKKLLLLPTLFVCMFLVCELSLRGNIEEHLEVEPSQEKVFSAAPLYSFSGLNGIHKKRRHHLRQECKKAYRNVRKELNISSLDHIIADDDHRFLYCYTPKVACTTWKRILMIIMGKTNASDPLQILADSSHRPHMWNTLVNFTVSSAMSRLETYDKFMFVRHPFERLVSAFINKFQQNYTDYFRLRYGRPIVKAYRVDPSQEALDRGHDVTFPEFVEYLIDPVTRKKGFNEHWRPMHELCRPCHIRYDIIGKYDSLESDARYVLEKLRISNLVEFPKIVIGNRTKRLVSVYLSQLTKRQLSLLYKVYELDFRLFGYSFKTDDN